MAAIEARKILNALKIHSISNAFKIFPNILVNSKKSDLNTPFKYLTCVILSCFLSYFIKNLTRNCDIAEDISNTSRIILKIK